jgi:hypothetical protein
MMAFNDRATDGKPHAHATIFGGVEGVKQLVDALRIDTNSCVLNYDTHRLATVPFRLN